MRRAIVPRWRHGAALVLVAMAGCTKSVVEPTTVVEPPQIVCPAPQTARSLTGGPTVVTFSPTTTLGAEPVSTVCTPASGTSFAIGTTAVTCTATDARQRVASCSFNVTVDQPPRLSVTRFVAFGDSMTWGEDGVAFVAAAPLDLTFDRPTVRLVGREYPTVLQQFLRERYTAQSPSVVNDGLPGEKAGEPSAVSRFTGTIATRQFDVVLLMEGANDIYGGTGGNPPGIAPAIANLRRMIGEARSRGVRVYLATIPPQNPEGPRGALGYQTVPLLNAQIRLLATSEGVPLVDVFQAFNGDLTLLGADGLHPNANGYARIAETFRDAIRATLEVVPTLGFGF